MHLCKKIIALVLLLSLLLCTLGCGQGNGGVTDDQGGNNGGAQGDGGSGDNGGGSGNRPEKLDPVEVLPGFDYTSVSLAQYVSFGGWDRRDMQITITEIAAVTEESVKAEFNGYFNAQGNVFYRAVADPDKAVANGDVVYMYYTGVTMTALQAAVSAGKIPDVRCTGMTYQQILDLSLGFDGGTTNNLTPLEIGSKTYIDGFESGLVGYTVATAGEADPARLTLTFPPNYDNADLAGQQVIFFCKLVYLGDKAAGAYTADTISVEMVNTIMGKKGEAAYTSLDECFDRIRTGLEKQRSVALRNAKSEAIFKQLLERAIIPTVPDEMLNAYVDSVISSYLSQFVNIYNSNKAYYEYYFGSALPSEQVVAAYLGYKTEDYREKMKTDVAPAVKQEMIFWYYVQEESITLTDEEMAAMRAEYIDLYGASIFEGIADSMIREQFLRDKFVEDQIATMEEKGNIAYTPATEK